MRIKIVEGSFKGVLSLRLGNEGEEKSFFIVIMGSLDKIHHG